jgi:hypothetical protein
MSQKEVNQFDFTADITRSESAEKKNREDTVRNARDVEKQGS